MHSQTEKLKMSRRGQTDIPSFAAENKPVLPFNPIWIVQVGKVGLFSQRVSGYVCILPVATPVHQQLENALKYTWSDSVCNFSSGLGVLNEDQLLKSASFGGIWLRLCLQRGPLSSRFYIKPQRLQTFCISHKTIQQTSGETRLTSQTAPFMQIYQYIFPTDCLVMKRDLPLAQGFKKPSQPQPKFESKFKGSPLPLNTAGICSNRLDLGGHVAPRI